MHVLTAFGSVWVFDVFIPRNKCQLRPMISKFKGCMYWCFFLFKMLGLTVQIQIVMLQQNNVTQRLASVHVKHFILEPRENLVL